MEVKAMQNELVERITHEVWRQDTDATDLADCRTETMRVFAAIEALGLSVTQGWQDIASAPHACHVLATRFMEDCGEWSMEVVLSPPSYPFTHWQPLPTPPLQAARGGA
jgi:hypothetical protein